MKIEHGIKEASTEIFLAQIDKILMKLLVILSLFNLNLAI